MPFVLRESVIDDLRQPERGAVQPYDKAKIDDAADPDLGLLERIRRPVVVMSLGRLGLLVGIESTLQQAFFFQG